MLTLLIFTCMVSRNIEIHTQMYPFWKLGSGFIAKCVTSALSNSIGIIRRSSPFPSDSSKHRVPRRLRIYLSESVALLLSISQAFSLICSLMVSSPLFFHLNTRKTGPQNLDGNGKSSMNLTQGSQDFWTPRQRATKVTVDSCHCFTASDVTAYKRHD